MGILGLAIQRNDGIPIVSKTWTEVLSSFNQMDSMLTAGFMSAITAFANSFEQNIDFIQFSPKKLPESNGISAVLKQIDEIIMICFTEPYLFLDKVTLKLTWIYEFLIEKKLSMLQQGNVFSLSEEEEMFMEDILFDKAARILIEEKKDQIIEVFDEIGKYFYHDEIQGFSINSFDNSIIFTYLIDEQLLSNYLCNMGKGGRVKEWEIQYKPVWLGNNPVLVSYTNSAVKISVSKIVGLESDQPSSSDSEVPLYYYIITDVDCSIGPIIEKINTSLHPILMDYKIDANKLNFEI
ncbi:MAG: hypothetical protein ACTSRS_13360 [Candidatus Helarchaeota archaeon]